MASSAHKMRNFPHLLVAASLLSLAGCVAKEAAGDTTVYSTAPWVGGLVVLGLLALVGSIWIKRSSVRNSLLATGVFLALGVVFVPGLFMAHVTVTPEGFESQGGYYFLPDHHTIRFAELKELQVGGQNQRSNDWHCHMKDGSVIVIGGSDLLAEALPTVGPAAVKRGVTVKVAQAGGGWSVIRPDGPKD